MDPNGHIYISDEVAPEDAARLDGYLRGKAEDDQAEVMEAEVAHLRDELDRFRRQHESGRAAFGK